MGDFPRDRDLFESQLLEALRCGVMRGLRTRDELSTVGLRAVEKTLYPIIRDAALEYLRSKGYDYLADRPQFFSIGDVGTELTARKADGFLSDPSDQKPRYAIEIGMGDSNKLFADIRKSLKVWENHLDLLGTFVIFFERDPEKDESVSWMDGSTIVSPKRPEFRIRLLVVPANPAKTDALMSSRTGYQFLRLHRGSHVLSCLTISEKHYSQAQKHVVGPINRAAKSVDKFIGVHRVLKPSSIRDMEEITSFLDDLSPDLIILLRMDPIQYELENLGKNDREYISRKLVERVKSGSTLLVTGDWISGKKWQEDDILNELMPVEILGVSHTSGEWDRWKRPIFFGKDVLPRDRGNLDLTELTSGTDYCLKGFTKSRVKNPEDTEVNLEFIEDDTSYPIIASRRKGKEKVIWKAFTTTGGWPGGEYGFRNWEFGVSVLWKQVLEFVTS